MTTNNQINYSLFSNPPGGILLWIIIYLELFTFAMGVGALAYYGSSNRATFHAESLLLNRTIGTINTILLLTSGFFVAKAVHYFKDNHIKLSIRFFDLAIVGGILFLGLKTYEYYTKMSAGYDMSYSDFFMFYWILTFFHWVHVLVGIMILIGIRITLKKEGNATSIEGIEGSAAFWHMCDLIWLFLFPMLYLIF